MKYKIFVDGQEGTTGLQINERLSIRKDVEILKIDPEKRKDTEERKRLLNEADIAFLCLPDAAAKESVSLVENPATRVIDASTAHRTSDEWAYGIPELSAAHRDKIHKSNRVSVPGCYATGFNMIMYPLVSRGIVPNNYPASCHALSGYSGGGKNLIQVFEAPENASRFESPCFYALGLQHKHLPEMQKRSGLNTPPIFTPIIGKYYQGMTVAVPLHTELLSDYKDASGLHSFLTEYYKGCRFVRVMPFNADNNLDAGYLAAHNCNMSNNIQLFVFGNEKQAVIISRLDNLGKGSSGAAVQNMNIMLGLDEAEGL